jgi:hypothetical protein
MGCLSPNGLLRPGLSRETEEALRGDNAFGRARLRAGRQAGTRGLVALAVSSSPLCIFSLLVYSLISLRSIRGRKSGAVAGKDSAQSVASVAT